jgi:PmbA protein
MLDKIIKVIKSNNNITGYRITETMEDSSEMFFIKKNLDMDRAKSVHHYAVTVYTDFEEDGTCYKGSSQTEIHPTMNETEIRKAIDTAAYAARYVKNPYYPLVEPRGEYKHPAAGSFSGMNASEYMNKIVKAIYKYDDFQNGGINSCEIFLNRVYTHVVNSEGVDADYEHYSCQVELITTWKEGGEEAELYKWLEYSEFNPDKLSEEVREAILICREKAIAGNTPALGKVDVILTREAVKELFEFYHRQSMASSVYNHNSTWKVGDHIQGDEVKGDLITLTLNPFMKDSTCSRGFDGDGYPLEPVTIIECGELKRYSASNRYAHYLGVEPTGSIQNMEVKGGKYSEKTLKSEPHMEIAAFSDFSVDYITGDFGGEIRLAWYYDGKERLPVTGGSISGNICAAHNEIYLSNELQKDNSFEGPMAVKILNVNVAGV